MTRGSQEPSPTLPLETMVPEFAISVSAETFMNITTMNNRNWLQEEENGPGRPTVCNHSDGEKSTRIINVLSGTTSWWRRDGLLLL